jgi:hypothetical protein
LSKVVGFAQSMVQFDGKCASCGVSRQHKNFAGRRDGRPIPDSCHVALRRGRSPKDDKLYTRCYDAPRGGGAKSPGGGARSTRGMGNGAGRKFALQQHVELWGKRDWSRVDGGVKEQRGNEDKHDKWC